MSHYGPRHIRVVEGILRQSRRWMSVRPHHEVGQSATPEHNSTSEYLTPLDEPLMNRGPISSKESHHPISDPAVQVDPTKTNNNAHRIRFPHRSSMRNIWDRHNPSRRFPRSSMSRVRLYHPSHNVRDDPSLPSSLPGLQDTVPCCRHALRLIPHRYRRGYPERHRAR